MRGQSLARRLPALDGKVVGIEISDVPNRIAFLIRGEHLVAAAPSARGECSFGNGRIAAGMSAVILSAIAAVSERAAPREPTAGRAVDVTIRGRLEDFWRLATRAEDPDTLFFQRRLSIEGDTETGLHVKNLLDALDYDVEAHVRAVLGAPLADVAVALLRRLPFPVRRTTT